MKTKNNTEALSSAVPLDCKVRHRTPCQEIIGQRRIGGTYDQPEFAVFFCQLDIGHNGSCSKMPNV